MNGSKGLVNLALIQSFFFLVGSQLLALNFSGKGLLGVLVRTQLHFSAFLSENLHSPLLGNYKPIESL